MVKRDRDVITYSTSTSPVACRPPEVVLNKLNKNRPTHLPTTCTSAFYSYTLTQPSSCQMASTSPSWTDCKPSAEQAPRPRNQHQIRLCPLPPKAKKNHLLTLRLICLSSPPPKNQIRCHRARQTPHRRRRARRKTQVPPHPSRLTTTTQFKKHTYQDRLHPQYPRPGK